MSSRYRQRKLSDRTYNEEDERATYRDEIRNALETHDYSRIKRFYYYKICDSIIELDLFRKNESSTEHKCLIKRPNNNFFVLF